MRKYKITWEDVYGSERGEDIVEAPSNELAVAYWNTKRTKRNIGILSMEDITEEEIKK